MASTPPPSRAAFVTQPPTPAAFPESALRAVLAGCVGAWARSAAGVGEGEPPRLLYVDGFAGAEMQFGSGVARGAEEETRAAAAVRALDEGAGGATVHAVFAEEDPAHLQRIYADLERVAGGERLRATRDLPSLEPGEASLLESDFRDVAGDVERFAAGARAFVLLAPHTARKLPWELLRPLAMRDGVDLLVRLPHVDWEKQARFTGPLADLPAFARRIVEGASAMLGDAKHDWLPAWRAAPPHAAMDGVLDRFRRLLEAAAPARIVKPAALQADGAITYLFLVTSDPALALAFNAAARSAGVSDRVAAAVPPPPPAPASAPGSAPASESASPARPAKAAKSGRSRKAAREPAAPKEPVAAVAAVAADPADPAESVEIVETAEATKDPAPEPVAKPTAPPPPRPAAPPAAEVLDLFGDALAEPEMEMPAVVDVAALGESLAARYVGRTVAWRDVLRDLASTGATADEAKRALSALKRRGRALFGALKDDAAEIEFPRDPAPPPPAAPRKRKRTEDGAGDDGGLFG